MQETSPLFNQYRPKWLCSEVDWLDSFPNIKKCTSSRLQSLGYRFMLRDVITNTKLIHNRKAPKTCPRSVKPSLPYHTPYGRGMTHSPYGGNQLSWGSGRGKGCTAAMTGAEGNNNSWVSNCTLYLLVPCLTYSTHIYNTGSLGWWEVLFIPLPIQVGRVG